MPTLPTQSFPTMVSNIVAGMQGRAAKLINFSVGSTLRAIAEGFTAVFLWFQGLVLQLLTATRLATSTGTDVDTWTADWMPIVPGSQTAALPNGSPRLGASAATGLVTFARFTPAPSQCFIPAAQSLVYPPPGVTGQATFNNAGSQPAVTLQSSDGSVNFVVTVDPTNSAYSPSLGGYILQPSVSSVAVPVAALTLGTAGNVANGGVSVLTTPVTGIDTVSNSAAFTNAVNQESDAALKARFQLYIQSLRQGTEAAIGYAVMSVQAGMQYQIWEAQDPGGGTDFGAFTVYVDDGSGAIPTVTLNAAMANVFSMAAAGTRPQVLADTAILANVVMTITTDPALGPSYHPTAVAQVAAAVGSYINSLGLGKTPAAGTLSYIKLGAVAAGIAGVTDVTGFTINGVIGDLVPGMGQVIKAGTIVVS